MSEVFARIQAELVRARQTYGIPPLPAWMIVVSPWALLFLFGILLAVPSTRSTGVLLLRENSLVEWSTFFAFLVGGIQALALARRARTRGERPLVARWYLGLGIALLVAAMEEISWGQWLFGFKPPSGIAAINQQKELNLHNLPGIEGLTEYLVLGVGLAGLAGTKGSLRRSGSGIAVPGILASCFLAVTVTTGLDLITYQVPIQRRFDEILIWLIEVVEMLVGVSGLLYVWLNARVLEAQWNQGEARRVVRADGPPR